MLDNIRIYFHHDNGCIPTVNTYTDLKDNKIKKEHWCDVAKGLNHNGEAPIIKVEALLGYGTETLTIWSQEL